MFRLALYQVIKKERDQMMISQEKVSKIYKVFERLSQELLTDLLQHFQKKKYKKCNFFFQK